MSELDELERTLVGIVGACWDLFAVTALLVSFCSESSSATRVAVRGDSSLTSTPYTRQPLAHKRLVVRALLLVFAMSSLWYDTTVILAKKETAVGGTAYILALWSQSAAFVVFTTMWMEEYNKATKHERDSSPVKSEWLSCMAGIEMLTLTAIAVMLMSELFLPSKDKTPPFFDKFFFSAIAGFLGIVCVGFYSISWSSRRAMDSDLEPRRFQLLAKLGRVMIIAGFCFTIRFLFLTCWFFAAVGARWAHFTETMDPFLWHTCVLWIPNLGLFAMMYSLTRMPTANVQNVITYEEDGSGANNKPVARENGGRSEPEEPQLALLVEAGISDEDEVDSRTEKKRKRRKPRDRDKENREKIEKEKDTERLLQQLLYANNPN